MFDIGLAELLIIGIVALIVIGPKDLPGMFRNLGRITARMRAMARDFQRTMEQAADESGVKQTAREMRDMASGRDLGLDEVRKTTDSLGKDWSEARDTLRKAASGLTKPSVKGALGEVAKQAMSGGDGKAAKQAKVDEKAPATTAGAATGGKAAKAASDASPSTKSPRKPRAKPAPAPAAKAADAPETKAKAAPRKAAPRPRKADTTP